MEVLGLPRTVQQQARELDLELRVERLCGCDWFFDAFLMTLRVVQNHSATKTAPTYEKCFIVLLGHGRFRVDGYISLQEDAGTELDGGEEEDRKPKSSAAC